MVGVNHPFQGMIRARKLHVSGPFCSVRSTGLEPVRSPTRPSNVRVCLFRHDRMHGYYTHPRLRCQANFAFSAGQSVTKGHPSPERENSAGRVRRGAAPLTFCRPRRHARRGRRQYGGREPAAPEDPRACPRERQGLRGGRKRCGETAFAYGCRMRYNRANLPTMRRCRAWPSGCC